jgi:hypothetical protein
VLRAGSFLMPLHCQGSRCLPASVPCLLITSRYVYVCRADRFLRVQVQRGKWCSDAGKAAIQHLATHGLSFACRRYRYIGHKVSLPALNLITKLCIARVRMAFVLWGRVCDTSAFSCLVPHAGPFAWGVLHVRRGVPRSRGPTLPPAHQR